MTSTLRNFLQEDLQARHAHGGRGATPRRPVVVAHPESNSLLVTAAAEDLPKLERLIRSLDEPIDDRESSAEPSAVVDVRIDGEDLVLTPKASGGIPIRELVEIARGVANRSIVHHQEDGNPTRVRFEGPMRVPRNEFFELFQTLLFAEGYACVVHRAGTTEIVEVVHAHRAQSVHVVPIDELEHDPFAFGSLVSASVSLDSIDASEAATALGSFVGSAQGSNQVSYCRALDGAKTVLLRGFAPRVVEAARLLERIDTENRADREHRVVVLEHVEPGPVCAALDAALGARESKRSPEPAFRAVPVPPSRLMLTGPKATVTAALDLIARLDIAAH